MADLEPHRRWAGHEIHPSWLLSWARVIRLKLDHLKEIGEGLF
jgi:hypothetical protein